MQMAAIRMRNIRQYRQIIQNFVMLLDILLAQEYFQMNKHSTGAGGVGAPFSLGIVRPRVTGFTRRAARHGLVK
jgi:hypothetical protein